MLKEVKSALSWNVPVNTRVPAAQLAASPLMWAFWILDRAAAARVYNLARNGKITAVQAKQELNALLENGTGTARRRAAALEALRVK